MATLIYFNLAIFAILVYIVYTACTRVPVYTVSYTSYSTYRLTVHSSTTAERFLCTIYYININILIY